MVDTGEFVEDGPEYYWVDRRIYMANTQELKKIRDFVIEKLSSELGQRLVNKQLQIGFSANGSPRLKEFDGVSEDREIVVSVASNSGKTSGGKKPTGKIRSVYSSLYFLNLTRASKKIMVLTDPEFYDIFLKDSEGLLNDIELRYIDLPPQLKEIAKNVKDNASKEMS